MKNVGLEDSQAGVKISGRNINNLRYADGLIGKDPDAGKGAGGEGDDRG